MKKLFSLILAVCMALTLNLVAFADNATESGNRVEVSLEYIIDDWIKTNYQEDVNVSRIVGLCDPNDTSGKNIGHLVTFETNGIPNGYIVLSREEEDYPIVEFALGGESVYDRLETQITANNDAIAIACCGNGETNEVSQVTIASENILYTDFINYSLAIKNGERILLFDQYNIIREFEGNLPNDGVVTYESIYEGYVITPSESTSFSSKVITGGTNRAFEMDYFAEGEGNCAPTAATNIINLYANNKLNGNNRSFPILLANGTVDFTYARLTTLVGYVPGDGVYAGDMVDAIRDYCSERGRTCSTDKYSYNYWSDYTRDIGKNVPIYLSTGTASGEGHSQVVVGYREYSNGNKYLEIYSGWYSYATYVKFQASVFSRFNGWAIYIS